MFSEEWEWGEGTFLEWGEREGVSLEWEGTSLALLAHHSSDGVKIKIPYGV